MPYEVEVRAVAPEADGGPRWLLSGGSVERHADGTPLRGAGVILDVTARIRIQQALDEQRAREMAYLDHLPVGIWCIGPTCHIEYGNAAAKQIWAGARYVGLEEFGQYKAWWHATGEPLAPEEWAGVRALRFGHITLNEEIDIECFDGARPTILNSAVPVRAPDGAILGAIVLNQDVTEAKRVEAQVRRLATIVEGTTDFVAISRLDGRLMYINQAGRRMLGIPEAEAERVLGIRETCPSWVYRQSKRDWLPSSLREGSACGEAALLSRNGREIPVSFVLLVHRRANGEPESVSIVARDITERKRVEKELRESEQRFRVALAHTPILVYEADLDWRYRWLYNNPRRFGEFDVIGKRDDEILPYGQVKDLIEFKENVLASGVGARREIEFSFAGGIEFWEVNAEPLREQDGTIVGLIVAAMDITERKRVEHALREADRRKDEFLATLAHELRNPRAPVSKGLYILRRAGAGAAERNRHLEMIERQVNHMVRLIDDLLEVSRITRGKVELRKEIGDLSGVVRSAIDGDPWPPAAHCAKRLRGRSGRRRVPA